jgi:hypothetical protein
MGILAAEDGPGEGLAESRQFLVQCEASQAQTVEQFFFTFREVNVQYFPFFFLFVLVLLYFE